MGEKLIAVLVNGGEGHVSKSGECAEENLHGKDIVGGNSSEKAFFFSFIICWKALGWRKTSISIAKYIASNTFQRYTFIFIIVV